MRLLRTIRGIIGTALAWTLPWTVLGGAMLVAYFVVRRGDIPYESLRMAARVNWILFRVGAETLGYIGALSGGLFAAVLAVGDRRSTFAELSVARLAAYGAIGGAGMSAIVVTSMAALLQRPVTDLAPLVGISAALGAGSAAIMLRIARRATTQPEAISPVDEHEPEVLAEARNEVERLLAARDNLTKLAADERS